MEKYIGEPHLPNPSSPSNGSINGMLANNQMNSSLPNSNSSSTPPPNSYQPNPLTPPANKPKSHFPHLRSILSTILMIAIAPIIAVSITAFALQSYQVDGQSMETTLQNRDRLIVDKFPRTIARITHHPYIPHRGDIIIFNQAGLPDLSGTATKQLIKRVIGLPGDRVLITDGKITVFNKEHPQGFDPDKTLGYHTAAPVTEGEVDVTLEKNQIFVCGDNRPNSEDSRYFGAINAKDIIGKLVFRLLPLDKAEKF
jgi:signal peptidase I